MNNKITMRVVPDADTEKGSSPVYDPAIIEAAKACVPRPLNYEVSLQKLDGTELYQWHERSLGSAYWHGSGDAMEIAELNKELGGSK